MRAIARRYERPLAIGAAGAIVVVVALLPLLQLLGELPIASTDSFAVLATWRSWSLLLRSLVLSGAVTTCALVIGIPFGLLIARFDVRAPRALWLIHAFPMFLPPFVLALGWFHVLGSRDIAGKTVARILFSEAGVVWVLALAFAPVVTSLVAIAVLGMDASLEDAARVVARPWRIAVHVLLPAARPAIALAAIVVYALSLSELGVPMFLRVPVLPAAVLARVGGIDYAPGEAFLLVLPLVPVAILLLFLERHFVAARSFAIGGLRGVSRAPLKLGRWRALATATVWLLAILSVAPIAFLAWRASRGDGLRALPSWLGQAPWTSITVAAIAATIIAGLGLILGHAFARRIPGSRVLDAITVLVFVMPASVTGVGLIALWNRPATQMIYGSIAIIVLGFVARYTVVGVRTVAAVVRQSPVHLEEAAATCGAGFLRRLVRVVLPVNARGVAFGWLLALVFCLRDLETAVLFYPPGREPLTVRLFTLEANGPPAVVAGLATTQVLMTAVALTMGALLIPRGTRA